jgi:hypothetical protein
MTFDFIRDDDSRDAETKWMRTGWESVVFRLEDDLPEPLLGSLHDLGEAIRGAERLLAAWK